LGDAAWGCSVLKCVVVGYMHIDFSCTHSATTLLFCERWCWVQYDWWWCSRWESGKLISLLITNIIKNIYGNYDILQCLIWSDTSNNKWSATTQWISENLGAVFGNRNRKICGEFSFWCSLGCVLDTRNMGWCCNRYAWSCFFSHNWILPCFTLFRLSTSSEYLSSNWCIYFLFLFLLLR